MKKIINEFKEFALKGNMFDMAIGVIMGSAVSAVVNSMVTDLITPLVSFIAGNQSSLADKAINIGEVSIRYGAFMSTFLNFLITAFVIFMMVKIINSLNRKKDEKEKLEKAPKLAKSEELLQEILNELKKEK